jgi:hypothetical protein
MKNPEAAINFFIIGQRKPEHAFKAVGGKAEGIARPE